MKTNNYIYITALLITSFLFSDYTEVSKKPFSFQKAKKDGVIKSKGSNNLKNDHLINPNTNNNLKTELLNLENDFQADHELIKNNYKDKILSLKNMQKSDIKGLKQNYKQRRKAIYKKYGVKPPKKNDQNTMMNHNVFKPQKKDKKVLPMIKSKK